MRASAALRQRGRRAAARGVPRRVGGRSRSTRPSAASRPSRSPATRRASPRCCRASGSPPRSSPTCASCATSGARLHGASDPDFRTIVVLCDDVDRRRTDRGRRSPRTSATATPPPRRRSTPARAARATITQKAPGVISGLGLAAEASSATSTPPRPIQLGPGGRVARGGRGRARGRGRRARAADRRADGAELPRPAVGHRHADRARGVARCAGAGGTAQILDTRKTTPGLRRLEKAAVAHGGGVNHRAGPLRRDPDQGEPLGAGRRRGRGGAAGAGGAAGPADRGRGARRRGDRRGARRGRAAAAARQHDARRGARGGGAGRRAARSSRCPAA